MSHGKPRHPFSGWVLGTFHENQSGQWKLSAEKIYYTLDAKFIDTGINYNVSKEYVDEDTDQLMDVRSFPEGDRNCYALPPGQGKNHKYLIRLGSCSGTPFISVLELQQLNDSIYSPTEPGSLLLHDRWDFGTQKEKWSLIRSKDDVYDRIWRPFTQSSWESINSSVVRSSFSVSDYKLPGIVMATAATPANESEPLRISLDIDDDPSQSYTFTCTLPRERLFHERKYHKEIVLFTKKNKQIHASTNYQCYGVDAIKGIKSEYAVSRNWQGDPCLPIKYQWDGLTCSLDISPAIITLNLSSSNLAGNILTSFSGLKSLQNLDLSYNNLTGPVPEFFADLPSLTTLNLTGNNLTGSVPQAVMDKLKDGTLSLGENPSLCQSASCQGKEKKKSRFLVPVLIAIPNVIVILILITALAMIIRKFRRRETKEKSGNSEFTYSEVVSITNNFSQTIGRGGFGQVFLGTLADGTQVAVKVHSESSIQEAKALQAEVKLLTRVHHKNLVRLIGYCDDGTNMVLIYEYMSNGNLQQKLSGREAADVLNWEERLQIAVDAAHGLEYLHNGCKPPIVHRDMKSSNILLTETLEAKIADFGMSRDLESGALLSTDPVGTPGYLDPEYQSAGLNKKSDVYSFGIVLLELLTGRPAIIPGGIYIVVWVSHMIERGDIESIVDRRLQGEFNTNSAWKAVEIALACVASTGMQRPDMSHVVVDLKECLETGVASRRIKMVGSHLEDVPVVLSTESAPHAR
ncbi:putative leucine-rich repeat receptor-like serine/threonine-protein kinase [Vitis vinifera]|uniref:non-specific serine/threonine protein kinase n=1 Tax=Vitis vinifera TaxID=29760 RepID=A0A438EW59_VITVI|nr:putative leucine-rich repeat receptor-like serine/threonine-protein kinase [Vitis vinifera]